MAEPPGNSWFVVAISLLMLGTQPGCGWRHQYHADAALADRMVADLASSPSDLFETDPVLETPPDGQVVPVDLSAPGSTIAAPRAFTLDEAIAEAFRSQPRLKAQLESIEQAKQGENVAFAPFLPLVSAGYSVGSYAVGVGGIGVPVPGGGNFNFLPPGGVIPIGFNFNTGFELAEFRVQWLVTDFGKIRPPLPGRDGILRKTSRRRHPRTGECPARQGPTGNR